MTRTFCDPSAIDPIGSRPPGFLLAPFRWARQPVLHMLQREPALLVDLVHIGRVRLHLIALALAHIDGDVAAEVGAILFRGSAGQILDTVIGSRPAGLKHVVGCLPSWRIIEADSYRRLVLLLSDPVSAWLSTASKKRLKRFSSRL